MRVALTALVLLMLGSQWARASELTLPRGETLAQLEWTADGKLLLLTSTGTGWALRLGDPATGELSVVPAPRSFAALPAPAEVRLSPAGNGVVALVESQSHTSPGRLWLYRLAKGRLDEVNLRKLDRGFFPAGLAWSDDGGILYVSASRYLGSDNASSIIAVTADGDVQSAVIKGNIDLVSQHAYIPGRSALLVRAAGIRGEYPAAEFIALVTPGSAEISVLHTEADDLSIEALPDGSAFVAPPAGQAARQRWILLPGESRLRRSAPRLPVTRWTASRDGRWLGGIVDGKAAGKAAGQNYGVLQDKQGGGMVVTPSPCSDLRFAPDSHSFAAVSADRTRVSVLAIPASSTE